jgi:hypothetical protein
VAANWLMAGSPSSPAPPRASPPPKAAAAVVWACRPVVARSHDRPARRRAIRARAAGPASPSFPAAARSAPSARSRAARSPWARTSACSWVSRERCSGWTSWDSSSRRRPASWRRLLGMAGRVPSSTTRRPDAASRTSSRRKSGLPSEAPRIPSTPASDKSPPAAARTRRLDSGSSNPSRRSRRRASAVSCAMSGTTGVVQCP